MSEILIEILSEETPLEVNGKLYLFKHFTLKDYLLNQKYYSLYYNQAISRGLKSEKDLINDAIKDNCWSESDEQTLVNISKQITKYKQIKDNQKDFILKNQTQAQIDSMTIEQEDLIKRKKDICQLSAEFYAEKKRSSKLIGISVFDPDTNCYIDEEYIDNVMSKFYDSVYKLLNSDDVITAAYTNDFFDLYNIHEKEPSKIFNKSGYELTLFQKNIILIAKMLMNKLKNCYEMPDNIKSDAIKILKFDQEKEKKKKEVVENMDDVKASLSRGKSLSESMIN